MLTAISERSSYDPVMFRRLLTVTNDKIQPQLRQRILYSIKGQNVTMCSASASASDNPQNLPRLPVPKLNDTIEKYLRSVKPLLNEKEFANTVAVLKAFSASNGVGQKLQQFLLDKTKSTTNWLELWWLNYAYLGFRESVVVYSSPGQAFPLEKFKNDEDRLNYTAKLISAALSYKLLIDNNKIPVDKMGKDELDMNQYKKIFGTCRIPALPIDQLQFNQNSKHIIIAYKNHFFKLAVLDNHNKPLSEKQLLEHLHDIVTQSANTAVPIGILSSDQRDNWAKAYKRLITDAQNKKSVQEIQKSLFLVCLDAPIPTVGNDNRQTSAGKQFIHGGGSSYSSGNRWFDKTVQFVLGADGNVGLTYEHSPSEGQPIAVMVDYLYNFIKKDAGKSIPDLQSNPKPELLKFNVNSEVQADIDTAKKNIDKLIANLDLNCFTFKSFGKEFVKSQKLSPDSFLQMAMQYAFYRLHKEPAAHYESAATRKYIGGRTETIRSCSIESVNFAKTMLDSTKSDADKVNALKAAINSHKQYSVEAVNGFGVDRHFLGLKLAAQELGIEVPAIYKDPSWVRSTHMRVSSSQVATKCDGFMCYGPTAADGYGCCYNPRPNDVNIAVSAFVAHPATQASKFRAALEESLTDMHNVLAKSQKSKM